MLSVAIVQKCTKWNQNIYRYNWFQSSIMQDPSPTALQLDHVKLHMVSVWSVNNPMISPCGVRDSFAPLSWHTDGPTWGTKRIVPSVQMSQTANQVMSNMACNWSCTFFCTWSSSLKPVRNDIFYFIFTRIISQALNLTKTSKIPCNTASLPCL